MARAPGPRNTGPCSWVPATGSPGRERRGVPLAGTTWETLSLAEKRPALARLTAFGFDPGLAEHALEDRIDVLEMMAEVEVLLELGLAQMLAHILVRREQR